MAPLYWVEIALAGYLAWPGTGDGLGQGGVEAEMGQGTILVKKIEKIKVLRMEFSIVENLSGPQESVFNLSRGLQLHFN